MIHSLTESIEDISADDRLCMTEMLTIGDSQIREIALHRSMERRLISSHSITIDDIIMSEDEVMKYSSNAQNT